MSAKFSTTFHISLAIAATVLEDNLEEKGGLDKLAAQCSANEHCYKHYGKSHHQQAHDGDSHPLWGADLGLFQF